jgi:2-oxoglutarate dehydrogenase E2 component (dihydrolipoamide succinyltransferase)
MAQFELIMPKLGEGITEATITRWLKNEGDPVSEDEAVVEIATDKVDSEIPSPVNGIIKKFLFKEGDIAGVDHAIAWIETEAAEEDNAEIGNTKTDKSVQPLKIEKAENDSESPSETVSHPETKSSSGRFYSPLVKSIASKENISIEELDTISGSGKDNRVTKDDILSYIEEKGKVVSNTKTQHAPAIKIGAGDEVMQMSRLRKLIVQHMVSSEATNVHVTSVIEIDVTNLVKWREKHKTLFEKREGVKLTYTPIFIWAIALMLKEFPMLNSSVDNDTIILRKNINVGMAAALPDGNLIVPVIRNADEKSLLGLAKSVNDLATRARANKLQPDEIQGGTFTLTNLGNFDTIFATPIINQPQVAILATGVIKKRPVVLETQYGDTIAIRSMMYLSMSYDHRVIDGSLGGTALKRIGEYLQNWDIETSI